MPMSLQTAENQMKALKSLLIKLPTMMLLGAMERRKLELMMELKQKNWVFVFIEKSRSAMSGKSRCCQKRHACRIWI